MTDKIIERIDIHGRILWLPPLAPDAAVALRALIERTIHAEADWDRAAEALDAHGLSLRLNVNRQGPQDYKIWTLAARDGTWAAARIAELLA